ncbi:MAG TPA: aldolase/citrate lyase family protein [Candidatus Polarisedimenticolia bacterium]|nr:aldolase/citrate lyase family protein [Candidatus Polarisedimenticolia bacterium]
MLLSTSSPKSEPTSAAGPRPVEDLPEGFHAFLASLRSRFESRRAAILAQRVRTLAAAHAGTLPGYLPVSEARSDWRIELPDWVREQRNQITGPADNAKLLIAMCNTKDPGCMPDGEDSITTDWLHVRAAQSNTVAAIRGTLTHLDPATGKLSEIRSSKQAWFYRPRGLMLSEIHAIPGEEISASLFDLGIVFFQTANQRRAVAKDPESQRKLGFYLPKTESAEEALWWSDVIAAMEEATGVPIGTTKVMFLIESLPAAYQIEEILHAARRHVVGLNLGRWDYMASLIHYKLSDDSWILPDRNTIPHDIPFFQSVRLRLVDACHRHGVLAIGGMTALFPDRKSAELNAVALQRLAADKSNEAAAGFDGAWTGHPDQCDVAIGQFPEPNQLGVTHPEAPEQPDLTPNPAGVGHISLGGTRDAVRTVIEYRFGVLSGFGARLIKGYDHQGQLIGGFMEDLATDRIYRLMLAQRIRHGVTTEDGVRVTAELVSRLFDEELQKILDEHRQEPEFDVVQERYQRARALSEGMIRLGEF